MEAEDRGQTNCVCCVTCTKYYITGIEKVVDLKNIGLLIYRRPLKTKNVNCKTGMIKCATETTEDAFILHNTSDALIKSTDILPEIGNKGVVCSRCRKIVDHARKLLQNVPALNKNDVLGICDHCKLQQQRCYDCEETLKKFCDSKYVTKQLTKERVKDELVKIRNLLKDSSLSRKDTGMERNRGHSELPIDEICPRETVDVERGERKLEIKELFYKSKRPGVTRTFTTNQSNKKQTVLKLDDPQLEVAHSPVAFVEPSEKRTKSTANNVGQITLRPAEDEPYLSDFDNDVIFSPGTKFEEGKRDKQKRSYKQLQSGKEKAQKQETKLGSKMYSQDKERNLSSRSEDNVKVQKSLESPDVMKKDRSKEAFLISVGAEAEMLRKDFFFLFPQKDTKLKKEPEKSSTELIKDTQDMLKAKAIEEKRRIEEHKRVAAEEKDKKRIAQEKSMIDKEMRKLAEKNTKDENKLRKEIDKDIDNEELKFPKDFESKKKEPKSEPTAPQPAPKLPKSAQENTEAGLKAPQSTPKTPQSEQKKTETERKSATKLPKSVQKKTESERKSATKLPKSVQKKTESEMKSSQSASKLSKSAKKITESGLRAPHSAPTLLKSEQKKAISNQKSELKQHEIELKQPKSEMKEFKPEPDHSKSKAREIKSISKQLNSEENEPMSETKQPKYEAQEPKSATKQPEFEAKESKSASKQSKFETQEPKSGPKIPKSDLIKPKTLQDEELNKNDTKAQREGDSIIREMERMLNANTKKENANNYIFEKPRTPRRQLIEAQKRQNKKREKSPKKKSGRLNQTNYRLTQTISPTASEIQIHYLKHKYVKCDKCPLCLMSDSETDFESKKEVATHIDFIKGQNIIRCKIRDTQLKLTDEIEDQGERPLLFNTKYNVPSHLEAIIDNKLPLASQTLTSQEPGKGVIRYALSDRTFIDKGWTMLPTEKVVRKMNVYRMRPAHPEFDWFEHNKNKGVMLYDSGEQLAEFDDNGRGRWFYKNGRLALQYYDAEELNAQQRFVIFSNGEPDERGRSRPYTILGTFDFLGNGVVFDHTGKIRLKYNQTEGVVLDRSIGPVSHWKWHTLNDPPVLQQVMIDTQLPHKDPDILKMGGPHDNKPRPDDEDMLAIEFDNFIKEKSKKLTQSFKPFQIKMKALKINEHFSLKVLDQATVYLIFRDGLTHLKLNIGMIIDHKEIVDTDTAEVGEVSNVVERFPARTDSLAEIQKRIADAQRFDHARMDHEHRVCPPEPRISADKLTAPTSRPLRHPLRTGPSTSTTTKTASCCCKSRRSSNNVYYENRLF